MTAVTVLRYCTATERILPFSLWLLLPALGLLLSPEPTAGEKCSLPQRQQHVRFWLPSLFPSKIPIGKWKSIYDIINYEINYNATLITQTVIVGVFAVFKY